jgi:ribonuclease BN (tRNA processing enzyme)
VIRQATRASEPGALEIIVLGAAPSAPQADGQGSGLLIRAGGDALLVDIGTGVVPRLLRVMDPYRLSAILVTHLHADHFLDLVSYRYGLPWARVDGPRVPVYLPPGGRARLADLAAAISEGEDFFTRGLDLREYDPEAPVTVGSLEVSFIPTNHYVPAWGVAVAVAGGRPRIVVSSDTGPNPNLVAAARGADLLVMEATLEDADDDVEPRGHLCADEAVETGGQAGVRRVLLTHLPTDRRAALRAEFRGSRPRVSIAQPGMRLVMQVEAERNGVVRRNPTEAEIAGWIEEAAKLPRVVDH